MIDSSTDNLPENVALTSPIFDTRGLNFEQTSVVVDWDQYFVEGYEAKIFVEVWNGHSWVEIYSETATTFNPDHQLVDITDHVRRERRNNTFLCLTVLLRFVVLTTVVLNLVFASAGLAMRRGSGWSTTCALCASIWP